MSETQITYPVWNSHHELSWLSQRPITGIPRFLSQMFIDWLGSPLLLFRLRSEIVTILADLPDHVAAMPLVEVDICLSEKAARYLEEQTHQKIYRIGQWLTNQFSSLRFQEIIRRQVPNTVIHLWEADASISMDKGYKILTSWTGDFQTRKKTKLLPIVSRGFYVNIEDELFIQHKTNGITKFGIEELATLLRWNLPKTIRQYPLVARDHIEIAATSSWNGIERIWIRHHAYHETWKISENTLIWERIARDAWTPVLDGNIVILGRTLPIFDRRESPTKKNMVTLPGSLLIKVGSND